MIIIRIFTDFGIKIERAETIQMALIKGQEARKLYRNVDFFREIGPDQYKFIGFME